MPRPLTNSFAARLRHFREAKGWSQSELDRRLGGCRGRTWKFEREKQGPPYINTIRKFAEALGCRVSDLAPGKK